MRILALALIVGLLFGCAKLWTPSAVREDMDILTKLAVRIAELRASPKVTAESCKSDTELLNEVAKWFADQIDGGDASQSEEWINADIFREALTTLGCPFIPELGASVGALSNIAENPLRIPLARHSMAQGVKYARAHDRRVCTRTVPRDGTHRSIPGAGSPSPGTTHTRNGERCGDPGDTRFDTRHWPSAGLGGGESACCPLVPDRSSYHPGEAAPRPERPPNRLASAAGPSEASGRYQLRHAPVPLISAIENESCSPRPPHSPSRAGDFPIHTASALRFLLPVCMTSLSANGSHAPPLSHAITIPSLLLHQRPRAS